MENNGELISFRLRKMTGIAYGSRNHEHRSYLDSIEIKLLQVLTFSVGIHVVMWPAGMEMRGRATVPWSYSIRGYCPRGGGGG